MKTMIFRISILTLAVLTITVTGGVAANAADHDDGSIQKIVFGAQGVAVEGDEGAADNDADSDSDDRRGGFDRYKDVPSGFVVDYLRIANPFQEGASYFDLEAYDVEQDDERYRIRMGLRDKWRMRYAFDSTPMVFGNRGRLPMSLEGGAYRIGDFIQQLFEDPNGNGIPFFTDAGETTADNALVQGLTNDLLTGTTPFDLAIKRRTNEFNLDYHGSSAWSVGFDYQRHASRGTQPLGSGTYQRITDVDGDGATDYDYFFSIRGIELPAMIEYDTQNTSIWANYRQDRWFGNVKYTYSEFENSNPFLLYDNPFWFNGVEGTSGSRRGLHEEARASLPPSNDAWNLALTAGFDLADHTRLTASFTTGEHSQDDPFAPITTNPANIGTKDLNGDGVVNAADDPTTTAILPQNSLNATSDITVYDLRLSSKPSDKVRINASWRTYEYDGGSSSLVIPGRTEYIESRIKTDFKGTSLAFVPHAYERQNLKIEGVFDLKDDVRLAAFWKQDSWDWTRYRSTTGNDSREVGNRAVDGTDDDTLGLRLFWDACEWADARVEYATSEREFSGAYQVGFSGENTGVRQFDIANRDRDSYTARFDFYPRDGITLGVEARSWDDDYPDSEYGYLKGDSSGWSADASFMLSDATSLYLYLDSNEAETDMHLRTKCSNCAPPPGASWSAPWGVPNYDWFPTYEDEDMSYGLALSFEPEGTKNRFDLEFDYLDATIEQRNTNPAPPVDLGNDPATPVGVSLAFDFPDQTNTRTTVEAKYIRKLSDRTSVGILYLLEDWDLDDFQVEQLMAYGANFLTVDDATRFLFLDAWYGSFDANGRALELYAGGGTGVMDIKNLVSSNTYDLAIYTTNPNLNVSVTDQTGSSTKSTGATFDLELPGDGGEEYLIFTDLSPFDLGGGMMGLTIATLGSPAS
ncbi:MAG: MtrB/PioB family outer membrane beta-barrel protein, partial [Thermoanaerobaculia bacterium]